MTARVLSQACPGGCGRRIPIRDVACTVCYPKIPDPLLADLASLNSSSNALIAAKKTARMWLAEHVAPKRDIGAERRAETRAARRAERRRAMGLRP